jgi:hypothetical protein
MGEPPPLDRHHHHNNHAFGCEGLPSGKNTSLVNSQTLHIDDQDQQHHRLHRNNSLHHSHHHGRTVSDEENNNNNKTGQQTLGGENVEGGSKENEKRTSHSKLDEHSTHKNNSKTGKNSNHALKTCKSFILNYLKEHLNKLLMSGSITRDMFKKVLFYEFLCYLNLNKIFSLDMREGLCSHS